jgi:hypothetical protein
VVLTVATRNDVGAAVAGVAVAAGAARAGAVARRQFGQDGAGGGGGIGGGPDRAADDDMVGAVGHRLRRGGDALLVAGRGAPAGRTPGVTISLPAACGRARMHRRLLRAGDHAIGPGLEAPGRRVRR